ncbi:hypothetical protein Mapa_006917 [Marchantia paleacea]|nr:hypothetical protein Mapa_006917 [Marchantia paleacea]
MLQSSRLTTTEIAVRPNEVRDKRRRGDRNEIWFEDEWSPFWLRTTTFETKRTRVRLLYAMVNFHATRPSYVPNLRFS